VHRACRIVVRPVASDSKATGSHAGKPDPRLAANGAQPNASAAHVQRLKAAST
jgi:hypothetical protein